MNLGALLLAYRKQHRIGVREMATILGVSHATLSRVERGMACDSTTLSLILLWALQRQEEEL